MNEIGNDAGIASVGGVCVQETTRADAYAKLPAFYNQSSVMSPGEWNASKPSQCPGSDVPLFCQPA